jgi:hypothetical protein
VRVAVDAVDMRFAHLSQTCEGPRPAPSALCSVT